MTDEDARALYEKVKDTRFGAPEKRKLQQIVFKTDAEADEALAKIKSGTSFEDIAKARGLTDKDIDLGEVTKTGRIRQGGGGCGLRLRRGRRQRCRQRPVRTGADPRHRDHARPISSPMTRSPPN